MRLTSKPTNVSQVAGDRTTDRSVVHVSMSDFFGGAARAAYRLHIGLRRIGWESTMLVVETQSGDPNVERYQTPPLSLVGKLMRRIGNVVQRRVWKTYESTRRGGRKLFGES
jgi:hypothetical protein